MTPTYADLQREVKLLRLSRNSWRAKAVYYTRLEKGKRFQMTTLPVYETLTRKIAHRDGLL